ncbi:leucine-rich repeat-containing protein 43-like isoform X2 [Gouania willdenowi]|uniref:leucine-rich repeat-containing protein 43-like isoform X2 n=1 Tax=Gouania willdenowi TaxID=441366 RepID=UPI0010547E24|nr:leucine-rich repeat-containing protein 43 isoform X2 [Gouania willdenowi]
MSSIITLSNVLEKLIHRLCLRDFPCGEGTWRQSTDRCDVDTESTDVLLDLLSCPHSPWCCDDDDDEEWSPQASALRRLAVLTPERLLHSDFIYKYFTSLSIVGRDVSVIDDGLLKFSKLEKLVLSANNVSEVSAENLPASLQVLELCSNRLGSLSGLTSRGSLQLQHLGLSCTSLSSMEDTTCLTGTHWPQLVSLDLSDCEFQSQRVLLRALSTLPQLRTLMLEGNPFTLTPSYPGLTVDSLPQLTYLDQSRISHHQRHLFRGLATMNELVIDVALATVSVGLMRGLPQRVMRSDERLSDFPVTTFTYSITYQFLHDQIPAGENLDSEPAFSCSETYQEPHQNCEPLSGTLFVTPEKTCCVSKHKTTKLPWSECLDFSDTQKFSVTSLGEFKTFLNQGLCLTLEEEKVLWWPAASEEVQPVKEKKAGKEEIPVKPGSTKGKKKKPTQELVQDAPIRRLLGTAHVPLQSLVRGGKRVHMVCDFGLLSSDSEEEHTTQNGKDEERKEKKKEMPKQRRGKKAASSKEGAG